MRIEAQDVTFSYISCARFLHYDLSDSAKLALQKNEFMQLAQNKELNFVNTKSVSCKWFTNSCICVT